jgi:glycosyltransferase involved in cell wall biosynthesis
MHVVMLSDLEVTGGAAIAASRLAEGLTTKDVKVSRIIGIGDATSASEAWDRYHVFPNLTGGYLPKIIGKASIYHLSRIYTKISARRIEALLRKLRPDIINVHNIHGAGWSPEIIASCTSYAPVVWTLHDMWSFTGRCAYSYECRKFLVGCDRSCPTAGEYPHTSRRYIEASWKIREEIFRENRDLVAVTPSRWLAAEAGKGLWNGHRVEVIPNGLPLDRYRPVARDSARAALGIEGDGPFILAAAQYLFERRKGGHLFLEALQGMDEELCIITFGMDKIEIPDGGNKKIFNLGFISEEKKILALNAADMYVHPAPVDNLPNIVMEAIACGTPVIGFNTGGVPEMVRESETGWIASDVSVDSLTSTIEKALGDVSHGCGMRESCRTIAEKEYNVALQAERYLELFESL